MLIEGNLNNEIEHLKNKNKGDNLRIKNINNFNKKS